MRYRYHQTDQEQIDMMPISDQSAGVKLDRPAGRLETYFTLLNDLQFQSNLVLIASYIANDKQTLQKGLIYEALRILVAHHPSLSTVIVRRKSTKNSRHSRVWEARLKSIDLDTCVQFIDNYDTSKGGLRRLIEQQHNTWFDTNDLTKPLWRLVVVNRRYMAFVYQHLISDGVGGLAFHKCLLSALNEATRTNLFSRATHTQSHVTISDARLPLTGIEIAVSIGYSYSILRIMIAFIYKALLRLLLPKSAFFFPSLPTIYHATDSKAKRPVVTRLHSFTISADLLCSGLEACRAHRTTITSLMTTLVLTTLSIDVYPMARYAIIMLPANFRSHLPDDNEVKSEIRNCSSVCYSDTWLGEYKAAGHNPSSSTESSTCVGEAIWDLAAAHRSQIQKMTALSSEKSNHTPTVIENSLAMETLPEDQEPLAAQVLPSLKTMGANGISLSSLGTFRDVKEDDGVWEINDMQFSVGAYGLDVGSVLYIALLSCEGGGCNVNISFAEGAVEADVVERLARGVSKRFEELVYKKLNEPRDVVPF